MLQNFTLIDIVGTVEASLLLTLVLFIPGYVIGWVSNVFRFRQESTFVQSLLSTPLAVSMLPISMFFLGRFPPILWTFLLGTWIAFAFILRRNLPAWKSLEAQQSWLAWAATIAIAWTVIVIGSLVDLQSGHRLYFSVPAYDYSLRVALTAASSRAVPPLNPYFASVPPVLLRYHYFWMLVCSVVPHLGSIGPRQAMFGGTIWAGIALMSLIGVCLRFFLNARERFGRKLLIGCGLLLVTGLDILPTIFLYVTKRDVYPDMEWWNEQITSWPDALLWCPHHVVSLIACVIGLLLLRQPVSSKAQRASFVLLAGLSFASAFGLSVLVSFSFAVFIALWLPYAALRRWWNEVVNLLAAGAAALLVSLPFLRLLFGPAKNGAGGDGRFFAVWIRPFPLGMIILASLVKIRGLMLGLFAVPLLPLNYFLELGFFALILAIRLNTIRKSRVPLTREEASAWMMVAVSFLIGTFLRSTSIQSNDLGWRCFLQAQLVLLLWATLWLDEWLQRRTFNGVTVSAAALCLILGVVGTGYQLGMLRAYPILLDYGKIRANQATWMDKDGQLGERTYALRSVYEGLGTTLPPEAIVQYAPGENPFVPQGLYSPHDAAAGDQQCGTVFGGEAAQCQRRLAELVPLFVNPTPAQNAKLDVICRTYGITAVVAEDDDAVWKRKDSWVWTRTPILANDRVRAFSCGDTEQQAKLAAGGRL